MRWRNTVFAAMVLWTGLAVNVLAQGIEQLARAFATSPSAKTRAALAHFASGHPTSVDGALAALALGAVEADDGDAGAALERLTSAQMRVPAVADYAAYWIARAQLRLNNAGAVGPALEPVWRNSPVSPLQGRSALVGADALLQLEQPKAALLLLSKYGDQLPQPQGYLRLAKAEEGSGNLPAAAAWFQSVYYGHPLSTEAEEAGEALERLRSSMGPSFPPAMPKTRLERATKLAEARQYASAKAEFVTLARELGGADRDTARVRVGATDYLARRTHAAVTYLEELHVTGAEANAERLYYLAAAYRRLNDEARVQSALANLATQHSSSPWRLRALMQVSYEYLVSNDTGAYAPVFTACYQSFPSSDDAPACHWRVTWSQWIQRLPGAGTMLKEHLERYPQSEKANAALYFLGRLSEQNGEYAAAKRYYQETARRYPNTYYSLLVRDRLKTPDVAKASPSAAVNEFLDRIPAPQRPSAEFQPNSISAQRIERARLLARAALDAWADGELRFGARRDAQPFVMAMELATISTRRGEDPKGLRHLKGTAAGYLGLPFDSAPEKFWKLAFPFPYRSAITAEARKNGLDPYLVAGLIRQESEFDPKVVSYARAIGLTQVMPSTGRELSRKTGMKGYSTASLKNADINLRLGTYYLRGILDSFDGRIEPALASYNAGKSRADRWLTWAEFREPAEFIESIPFNQTREYVQILLRNADMYRRLYEKEPIVDETNGLPKIKKTPPAKPRKKA